MGIPPFDYCKDGNNENFPLCDEPQPSCPSSQVQSSSSPSQVVSQRTLTCGPDEQCYDNSTFMLCGKNDTCCEQEEGHCCQNGYFCAEQGSYCYPGQYCCQASTVDVLPGSGLFSANQTKGCYTKVDLICPRNLSFNSPSSPALSLSSVTCNTGQECYNANASKLCDVGSTCCAPRSVCCTGGYACYPFGSIPCSSGICANNLCGNESCTGEPCAPASLGTTNNSAGEHCYKMEEDIFCTPRGLYSCNCTDPVPFKHITAGCAGTLCVNDSSVVHCCHSGITTVVA